MAEKGQIAVIIPTFNEEANLDEAIDSVKGWAGRIFVVDSFSTDRTVDIALARAADGVAVVQHKFENYSAQWNWAITRLPLEAEWTLKLDADERATPEFREEVSLLIDNAPPELDGIYFRRRLNFMGEWLNWGGVIENYDLRMWRTGSAVFEDRSVNEHVVVKGQTIKIRAMVEHKTSKSLSDWLDKHNRYASMEALNIINMNMTGGIKPRFFGKPDERRMWIRKTYYRIPFRALLYFLYRYVFRMGFLDGLAGLRYALLHASALYWIDLKIYEHRKTGIMPEVAWPARGAPHPRVAESPLQKQVDSEDTNKNA